MLATNSDVSKSTNKIQLTTRTDPALENQTPKYFEMNLDEKMILRKNAKN